jgi:hypothetical protein
MGPGQAVNNFNSFHLHSLVHLPNKLIMDGDFKGFSEGISLLTAHSTLPINNLSFLHSKWEKKGGLPTTKKHFYFSFHHLQP